MLLEIGTLGWTVMIGLVVVLLAVDLVLATLRPHTVGFREAAASLFYVAVALGFGAVFQAQVGGAYGAEYFAGYLVEKSLSVDNVFVFVIIMQTFAVPEKHQHKVLTSGSSPLWFCVPSSSPLGRRSSICFRSCSWCSA